MTEHTHLVNWSCLFHGVQEPTETDTRLGTPGCPQCGRLMTQLVGSAQPLKPAPSDPRTLPSDPRRAKPL